MPVIFPAQIDDSTTLPLAVDGSPITAQLINTLRSAVLAIENTFGVNPASVYGTVRARLDALENLINNQETITLTGDLGGTLTNPKVVGIQGIPIVSTNPTTGQTLIFNGSFWAPTTIVYSGFTAGGDLSGNFTSQTVIGLRGIALSSSAPSTNQILQYNGSVWGPGNLPSTLPPNGSAGGDLTGSYPNPTVAKINGITISGTPSNGQILTATGGSAASWQNVGSGFTASGDLSGTSSSQTVIRINGTTVPTAGATGTILQITGSNAASYGLLTDINVSSSAAISGTKINPNFGSQTITTSGSANTGTLVATAIRNSGIISVGAVLTDVSGNLSSGKINLASSIYVNGILGTANQANQTMGGDISGTTASSTVIKLQGTITLSGTPSTGQILTATSSTAANWQNAPSGSFSAGGDLSGSSSSQTVIKINSHSVATQTLGASQDGYVLTWDFVDGYYRAAPSTGGGGGGGAPTGPAGGNLIGTYPNPLITGTTPLYMADLSTTTPVGTRNVVVLDGYRAQNDAGGGTFIWVPGTFASDGGTIVVPTGYSTIGAWIRQDSIGAPFYNALHFGAIPDGATDNQPVLQHILDLCTESNPRALYLPARADLKQGTPYGEQVSFYAIGMPLSKNEVFGGGNWCAELYGDGPTMSGLCPTTGGGIPDSGNPTWGGPLIVDGLMSNTQMTFVTDGYNGTNFGCIRIGNNQSVDGYGYLNLSQYDIGDIATLHGGAFEIEFYLNPLNQPPPGDEFFFAGISGSMAGLDAGTVGTMTLGWDSLRHIICSLTTTSGTVSLASNLAGLTLAANTSTCIALSYDGSTVRLFVNGTCGTGMSAAATGNIVQYWWSEFLIGGNFYESFPSANGQSFNTGLTYLLGPIWVSSGAARHTTNYTPNPSAMGPCDGNTKALIIWTTDNQPQKMNLNNFIIVHTGTPSPGGRTNFPFYLNANYSYGEAYSAGSYNHDLYLLHAAGVGVDYFASLYSRIANIHCTLLQGFNYLRYCYGAEVVGNMTFYSAQQTQRNTWSWNLLFHNGSQFAYVGPEVISTGGQNWHLVCVYANIRISECFLGGHPQGCFLFNGIDVAIMEDCTIDDEGAIMQSAAVYFAGSGLLMNGGWINNSINGKPSILAAYYNNMDISATMYTNPVFSFAPLAQARNIPIQWSGLNSYGYPLIDGYHLGPVIIPAQEAFGTHIISFIADANLKLIEEDILWENIQVNDGYGITTTRQVDVLNPIAGYHRSVFNNTLQSISFGYLGGTVITIAAGKTAQIISIRDAAKTVTAAVSSSGLIEITATAHGLSTGNYVYIAGVLGTTEANGSWVITVINANNFTLNGSTFVHTYKNNTGLAINHYWRRATADV